MRSIGSNQIIKLPRDVHSRAAYRRPNPKSPSTQIQTQRTHANPGSPSRPAPVRLCPKRTKSPDQPEQTHNPRFSREPQLGHKPASDLTEAKGLRGCGDLKTADQGYLVCEVVPKQDSKVDDRAGYGVVEDDKDGVEE